MKPVTECDPLEATMTEASRHFLQTGEIPEALLQCFNYDGKWLGDTAASEFVDYRVQENLENLTIPETRRTITRPNGQSVLLTSYMLEEEPEDERLDEEYLTEEELPVRKDPTLVLPWHEIRGMCQVATHRNLSCPNLRLLNPDYSFADMCALTIHLPELAQVHIITLTAGHISIPKLEQAEYLAFATARHAEAPALQTVGQLQLGLALSARFPALRKVSGALVGYSVREFTAPHLETVNPGALAHDGLVLPEAWTIDTPSLKYVGKRLDAWSAENFYPNDLKVEGTWVMHPRLKARLAIRGPNPNIEL